VHKRKTFNCSVEGEKITNKNGTLPVLSAFFLKLKIKIFLLGLQILIALLKWNSFKINSSWYGGGARRDIFIFYFITQEKSVTLETKDGNLIILTEHHQTTIKAFNHEDFHVQKRLIKKILSKYHLKLS